MKERCIPRGGWRQREQGGKENLFPNHAHFPGQFWKTGVPPREEMVDEVYEDELDLQRPGSYFDSSTASAWSERSLDPGDIRVCTALCLLLVSAFRDSLGTQLPCPEAALLRAFPLSETGLPPISITRSCFPASS